MKPEDVPAELVEAIEPYVLDGDLHKARRALAAVLPEIQADMVLDVEGVALVLKAHRRDGRKSWATRVVCVCGWVGESVDHETHIAAALHVARLRARDHCDSGCINPGSGDCPTCKASCGATREIENEEGA